MKVNILIAVLVGVLGYGLTLYFEHSLRPAPIIQQAPVEGAALVDSENVPNFSFTDIKGNSHEMRDFSGQIVILNFWASWCAPCVKEFPDLLGIAQDYQDQVVLVALSSDFKKDNMERFLNKIRKDYKITQNVFIALDENTKITNDLFGTFRLPETLIIDRNQKQVHKFVGAKWSREEFEDILQRYL